MSSKKVQAQLQIDVSFIADTTKLVKSLENSTKGLNLGSAFTKQISTELSKGFKEVYSDLDRMTEGLSKKGLSPKQYTDFFNVMHARLKDSIKFTDNLKKSLQDAFNSSANKQALKDLAAYEAQLKKIKDLASAQKSANTRRETAIQKIRDELGLDYNISKRSMSNVVGRLRDKKSLTDSQQQWASNMGLDESKLKRLVELYSQILNYKVKIADADAKAKGITGKGGVNVSEDFLTKQIERLGKDAITPEAHKRTMAVATDIENVAKYTQEAADTMDTRFNPALNQAELDAQKLASTSSTIKEIFAQFGIYWSAGTIARGFKELIESSFEFYKSLDSALNQIYVVSDLSNKAVNNLKGDFINMAKETGMAIDDITRSAVLFYQQGLNTDEVMKMTEVTAQFAKVAGIDATDAANKLTAAVNGYCLSANEAAEVADKFNQVAASSAADINELSTAFSKAAAQANQAGIGMDNYLAYIATMEEKTREAPENIGTSLKTIFSRMQQVKTGKNTEDNVSVNQVETALKTVNIALRDSNGQLRDLEDIFAELGPKWQSLDRNTQAYLGTIIAGTRQQSRFITLMQNWDRVLELSEESANSAGMQALMHAKAMDSIESKMQQFGVAWQEFVSNLTSSDLIKGLIESLTDLLNIFSGGNKPIILMATAITLLSNKLKQLNGYFVDKLGGLGDFFKGKGSLLKENDDQLKAAEEKLNADTEALRVLQESKDAKASEVLAAQELVKKDEEDVKALKKQRQEIEKMSKSKTTGKGLMAAGMAAQIAGLAISQTDQNAGGIVSSAGTLAAGAGQLMTGNVVGGVVSLASGIYQVSQSLEKWDENIANRVKDSVNEVNNALNNYNVKSTSVNATENLIEEYEELDKKLYKTSEEQNRLNEIAQSLADSHDGIDTITDSYGNLSVNISKVNNLLSNEKKELQELLKELDKTEAQSLNKALGGLGNNTTFKDYTDKLFAENYSDYRNLLTGIVDGLTDSTRNITENIAKEFSSNLKDSIVDYVQRNSSEFIREGYGQGIIGLEKNIQDKMTSESWNDLYNKIDFLQQNMDDMSFSEAQDYLDEFFENWKEELGLTLEDWEILSDSINNTVFKNDSLTQFLSKVRESDNFLTGRDMETNLGNLLKEMTGEVEDYIKLTKDDPIRKNVMYAFLEGDTPQDIANSIARKGYFAGNDWHGSVLRGNEGNAAAAKIDATAKAFKELENKYNNYLETVAKEHGFEGGVEEAKQYIGALNTVADTLENTNSKTLEYVGSIKELYDTESMSGAEAAEYAKYLQEAVAGIEGLGNDASNADRYNYLANFYEANKDQMVARVRQQWEEILEKAWEGLAISTPKNLTSIAKELQTIGDDLVNMNDIIEDFNGNGGLALKTFAELANIIDGINLEELGKLDPALVEQYANAIDNLNLAYDANTGYITMNAESIASLQDIQELQTKSKIAGLINELKASKATTETQIAYIDAQIAATDAAINAAQLDTQNSITGDQLKATANETFSNDFNTSMQSIMGAYSNDVANQSKWAQATLKNLGKVAEGYSKFFTGIANGSVTDLDAVAAQAAGIIEKAGIGWEGGNSSSGIDWSKYETIQKGSEQQQALLTQLNSYKEKLQNTKAIYQATLSLTNQEIGLLENLYNSDLGNLKGTKGSGSKGSGSGSKIKTYIGQLKEIYNILNRISMLEHRLGTLDTYADISKGKAYSDILKQRLSLNEELLDQYDFLVSEQKQFTNGYKDFINSVEGLEGVFDFDKYGQIVINWEKYIHLQDQATDKEVTLKEKADDVYKTYTDMFKELQDDFDKYIKYLKQVIELQQEMIDKYVEMEDKAANAVKEIYQKILDTKLEAIDKEKEALEELRKAREQDRKDQENAKAVSNLQTNLQRAMMDTSGASDIAFIKAKNDIEDKLEDIAEDKYSKMLDDINNQLDDEKEMLQEEFDELWENMDWLFAWLDEEIMRDDERLRELLTQTDEWNTSSELQRAQLAQDWDTSFQTYMAELQKGSSIMDVWNAMNSNRERISQLDSSLVNEMSKDSKEIVQTIKKWQENVNSTVSNAVSSAVNSVASRLGGGSGGLKSYTASKVDNGNSSNNSSSSSDILSKIAVVGGTTLDIAIRNLNKILPSSMQISETAAVDTVKRQISNSNLLKYTLKQSEEGRKLLSALGVYKQGGLADYTGLAWLDGTKQNPEMVLNSLQTEHFIKFTNALDNMYGNGNPTNTTNSILIDNISFNVDSMSSVADGEAAFNAFVNKFKEIGSQSGIKINSFKNTL